MVRRRPPGSRGRPPDVDRPASHHGKESREENAMRSTTRRSASVLATFVVTAATVLAACGGSTVTTAPSAAPSTGASAVPSASGAAGHEPVTIVVGALRPGVTQAAADALFEQIGQFRTKYPWITV